MNLYKILVLHAAPKDSLTSMVCLVLAKDDETVYEFIKSEPEMKEGSLFNCWKSLEKDGEKFDIYDDNYDIVGTETFKQKIIRLNGEIDDESVDFSDAHYGITLYGWDKVKENPESDFTELIELGLVIDLN